MGAACVDGEVWPVERFSDRDVLLYRDPHSEHEPDFARRRGGCWDILGFDVHEGASHRPGPGQSCIVGRFGIHLVPVHIECSI